MCDLILEAVQSYSESYSFELNSKYLITYTSLFSWSRANENGPIQIDSRLTDYNIDEISLPHLHGPATKFQVLSIIIRTGQYTNTGHFTVHVRHLKENSWLYIDGLSGAFSQLNPFSNGYLKDIQFMI